LIVAAGFVETFFQSVRPSHEFRPAKEETVRPGACITVSVFAASALVAQQSETPAPRFQAADVHPSALSTQASPVAPQGVRGPFLTGARYDLRNATMVDLIVRAYGVTADKVLDGPSWLEYDRFDVTAVVPARTSLEAAKPMLQALLADRFQLVIHREDRAVPAYVLTAPKGKPKLKESDGSGDTGCRMTIDVPRPADITPGVPPPLTLVQTCKNTTMASLAEGLSGMALAAQYIGTNPVQDKSGLEGKFDFTFKYTVPNGLGGEVISIQTALDRQLGLKLEQESITVSVVVVEKASRTPSPNQPDVAKMIPAYPAEFEVATIRPSAPIGPGNTGIGLRIQPGGRVQFTGIPLKQLMQLMWGVQPDSIVGAPKWMDTDRYDIVAKMPGNEGPAAPNTPVDIDAISGMMRALLADRFKLAAHFEDRPMTAYTLTAPKPKLKKADPATRTKFSDGSLQGGAVPIRNSTPSRTVKFQNMTMAQFVETLRTIANNYVHSPVIDATGLEGGYDFTLTYSPISPDQLATVAARAPRPVDPNGGAADPIGGVSLFDAVEKQLGLKLVEQKRPVPVLVIDHIEEKPTEN
jgi:uncharacterized protein (TIGR03435 family)